MTASLKCRLLLMGIVMAALSASSHGAYQLVWQDEFEGTSLNMDNWSYQIMGDGGNNEWQYYTSRPQNSWVSGGYLTIQANKENYVVGNRTYNYTSARLRTAGKQDFLYGKLEGRIKVPKGQGIWPAFWMMPTDSVYGGWAASGEIDIMESINQADAVHGTLHFGGGWPNNRYTGGSYSPAGVDFSQDFHVYTIVWEPDVMRWYVDGILYSTKTNSQWWCDAAPGNPRAPFDQRFHFILNVAVGGNWPGYPDETTVFPQQFVVDWIRVYQQVPNAAPTVSITQPADYATVPAGTIRIEATASDADGSVTKVEFYEGSTYLGQAATPPYRLDWAGVSDGCYTLIAKAIDDLGDSATDSVYITVGSGCGQVPFHGSPILIPGKIEAENFDIGGPGIAYHDTTAGNSGNQYRTQEDVDIENCSDTGGGYNVGWVSQGEWLAYTLDVPAAGEYTIQARAASQSTGGRFRLEFNGVDKTGNIIVPTTGGWQSWTTVSTTVTLSAGKQVMRFVSDAADYNVNYFTISADMVPVPAVVGMDETAALSAITTAGLSVGTVSRSFSQSAAGEVISQYPVGGASAPTGGPVELGVSLGILGDLDGDGVVDAMDLEVMAGEWLSEGVLADIEPAGGDGVVNLSDLAVLASNWGLGR